MNISPTQSNVRCAIYTRKSTEEGLDQQFNSLDAQREACESYIHSQAHEGWTALPQHYDDGGFSGGNVERPALTALLEDIRQRHVDLVIVYKVDRLSRSLADFVRLIELLDEHDVSFVSVTQQFNTAHSMGRLTLNVLLSFAQFEREVTSERIRDKIAASKKKGLWMGGPTPLGYDVVDKQLVINPDEADTVKRIFKQYLVLQSIRQLKAWTEKQNFVSKQRTAASGRVMGGGRMTRGALYTIIKNPVYIGKVHYQDTLYDGQHAPIIKQALWDNVQVQLDKNRIQHRQRTTAKCPSLLAGFLFDDQGNAMSPTHTRKGDKRYRYYISQALLKYQDQKAGSVQRIAAETLEQAVKTSIGDWLDSERLSKHASKHFTTIDHHEAFQKKKAKLQRSLQSEAFVDQKEALDACLEKVKVSSTNLKLSLCVTTLLESGIDSAPRPKNRDTMEWRVPASFKRTGIEKQLIVNAQPAKKHSRTKVVEKRQLLTAMKLNQALLTGKAESIGAYANQGDVDVRQLSRVLPLAFQAPDEITKTIKL